MSNNKVNLYLQCDKLRISWFTLTFWKLKTADYQYISRWSIWGPTKYTYSAAHAHVWTTPWSAIAWAHEKGFNTLAELTYTYSFVNLRVQHLTCTDLTGIFERDWRNIASKLHVKAMPYTEVSVWFRGHHNLPGANPLFVYSAKDGIIRN